MRITLKVIKGSLVYTFTEAGKIVGWLGLYRTRENQLTAQQLIDRIK